MEFILQLSRPYDTVFDTRNAILLQRTNYQLHASPKSSNLVAQFCSICFLTSLSSMCSTEWTNYHQANKGGGKSSPDSVWPEKTIPGQFLQIKRFRMHILNEGRNKHIGNGGLATIADDVMLTWVNYIHGAFMNSCICYCFLTCSLFQMQLVPEA